MAAALKAANNPALVVGSSIDRNGAFDAAVDLAERMGATVFEAPVNSRSSFPGPRPDGHRLRHADHQRHPPRWCADCRRGTVASAGVSLANPDTRTLCIIGDGSSMYSLQAIWTAAQHELPVTFVVVNNQGYGALRGFAELMQSKSIPGMDVSGIDYVQLASSMGCPGDLAQALTRAHDASGPQLVEIAIDPSNSKIY
ncbi:MAG: thiamine pyrophosphate-dependent enzyme [Marinobacter sp.]